jgi:hypothetical protein
MHRSLVVSRIERWTRSFCSLAAVMTIERWKIELPKSQPLLQKGKRTSTMKISVVLVSTLAFSPGIVSAAVHGHSLRGLRSDDDPGSASYASKQVYCGGSIRKSTGKSKGVSQVSILLSKHRKT